MPGDEPTELEERHEALLTSPLKSSDGTLSLSLTRGCAVADLHSKVTRLHGFAESY